MNKNICSHTWEEIHLDRLKNNINNISGHLGGDTPIMAVIKADAYGHGAVEVAKAAQKCGVNRFAVACIDEAKQLRRHGIKSPILILGATPLEAVPDLFRYDITPTVFEKTLADAISEYSKTAKKSLKIHIKIDTGMGRIGFCCYEQGDDRYIDEIAEICRMDGINAEGIFTHFSCADMENGTAETKKQFENFIYITNELKNRGVSIPIRHCANSAAIAMYPEMKLDMVRAGIILYGEYPSEFVKANTTLKIEPVKEMKSTISMIKEVDKGKGISYGQNYHSKNTGECLATVCAGYADSYFRSLSGKSKVIINGHFAPQVGNICMDQMVVDISGIPDVKYGTEVILIGRSGDISISYSDIAEILGTINYEVMCDSGKRVVKAYFDNGNFIKSVNYLEKL